LVFFVSTPTFAELESGQQNASDKASERVIGVGDVVAYRGSSSPTVTRKVRLLDSTVTVRPAWTMPTWMRCPATVSDPRSLTAGVRRTLGSNGAS
jgi:hypothetical protein